jgi:hypothetical protein
MTPTTISWRWTFLKRTQEYREVLVIRLLSLALGMAASVVGGGWLLHEDINGMIRFSKSYMFAAPLGCGHLPV